MKTIYSGFLVMVLAVATPCLQAQTYHSTSTDDNDLSEGPETNLVGDPPGECSIYQFLFGSESSTPCGIFGHAQVIPTEFAEPCERDEECPPPTGSCPARADIVTSAKWPLGCWPVSIVDYSHAHYFAPFLLATFSGIIYLKILGETVDSVPISHSAGKNVGLQCCVINY